MPPMNPNEQLLLALIAALADIMKRFMVHPYFNVDMQNEMDEIVVQIMNVMKEAVKPPDVDVDVAVD